MVIDRFKRYDLVNKAKEQLGTPYVWGGQAPGGFDCSGLIYYTYQQNGFTIPRVAQDQYNASTKINFEQMQIGDLIFTGSSSSNVNHVVMYLGDNQYISAPETGKNVRIGDVSNLKNIVGYGTFDNTNVGITDNKSTTSNTTANTNNVSWWGSGFDSIKSGLTKFLVILFIIVLAIVFFMKAFDISIGGFI